MADAWRQELVAALKDSCRQELSEREAEWGANYKDRPTDRSAVALQREIDRLREIVARL